MSALQLIIQNERPMVSSRTVAEGFGKRHDNVLRAYENLQLPEDWDALNFEEVDYTDAKGETRPELLMTRDGFMLLVMGFTGEKAMKAKLEFIRLFNEMEASLQKRGALPSRPLDMFRLALASIEDTQAQTSKLGAEVQELRAQVIELKARPTTPVYKRPPAPAGSLTQYQEDYIKAKRAKAGIRQNGPGWKEFNVGLTKHFGVPHIYHIPSDRYKEALGVVTQLVARLRAEGKVS